MQQLLESFLYNKKNQQQQVFCILQPIGASCLSSEWNFFFHEWRGGYTYMQDGLQKKQRTSYFLSRVSSLDLRKYLIVITMIMTR